MSARRRVTSASGKGLVERMEKLILQHFTPCERCTKKHGRPMYKPKKRKPR